MGDESTIRPTRASQPVTDAEVEAAAAKRSAAAQKAAATRKAKEEADRKADAKALQWEIIAIFVIAVLLLAIFWPRSGNVSTAVQPTAVQPTAVQPTAVQPTAVQPTAVQPTAVQPTAVPTATEAPVVAAANTSNCRDGGPTGNPLNHLNRTPVGTAEFWTIQEVSTKPGNGFAGFDRWVQVTAPLSDQDQVFNLNVETIHEVEYCGTREAVIAYLSDVSTHVWAMRQSAADSSGKIPPEGEIPVVLIDSTTGSVTFLVAPTANSAPTMELIKSHIEVVHLQQ